MYVRFSVFLLFILVPGIIGPYPPTGDEVQPGSVLLPATRRGRYLANIVRRQAVDGTGIKFNKDADRMNAEAKKKIDVLSEELLPYIIAEQERRTTLHRRVMTAIQNGEKGVTIAEIRNKPPVIIRKGVLYRCPPNRPPREPDGSGIIVCEDDIQPKQILFESCLSAEDKELFNAEGKLFFCNRHKTEGPDLPRNGSTVIGCAPIERTTLNYTMDKCTLEDTDDVVVHYRYYPDRTYKFVTEIDPDREVCDHWNPCQIGYIYSLPSPDQASPTTELWPEFRERTEEYERDEFVPPEPEDLPEEFVHKQVRSYTPSKRLVLPASILPGNDTSGKTPKFMGIKKKNAHNSYRKVPKQDYEITRKFGPSSTRRTGEAQIGIYIQMFFPNFSPADFAAYYASFQFGNGQKKSIRFLEILPSSSQVQIVSDHGLLGQQKAVYRVPFRCNRCHVQGVVVRATDDNVYNVERALFKLVEINYKGKMTPLLHVTLPPLKPQDFGDYFLIYTNGDGVEERTLILRLSEPKTDKGGLVQLERYDLSAEPGHNYQHTLNYHCEECTLTDILCNGVSVVKSGKVTIVNASKMVSFNYPSFQDSEACVYIGFFQTPNVTTKHVVAIVESASPTVTVPTPEVMQPPAVGEKLEKTIGFTCSDCAVYKISANGFTLPEDAYEATSSSITLKLTFSEAYQAIYQAVFDVGSENVTKTILLADGQASKPAVVSTTVAPGGTDAKGGGDGSDATGASDAADGETTVAGDGAVTEAEATTAEAAK